MQTVCANCETRQGPFERAITGKPLCLLKNIEGCTERRKKLDKKRWEINEGDVQIRDD